MKPIHGISKDSCVGMAEMRLCINIIDGSCNKKTNPKSVTPVKVITIGFNKGYIKRPQPHAKSEMNTA